MTFSKLFFLFIPGWGAAGPGRRMWAVRAPAVGEGDCRRAQSKGGARANAHR